MREARDRGVSRPAVLLVGACAMLPWPLLGLLLSGHLLDGPDEWRLLFGGITAIPLLVVHATAVDDPDLWFQVGIIAVWLAALVLPAALPSRVRRSRRQVAWRAALQSLFAFAQAASGVLLLAAR